MRVRAELRLRNGRMIEARRSLGLSQPALAEVLEIPMSHVQQLEALKYPKCVEDSALKIASFLGLPSDEVFPVELRGKKLQSTAMRTVDVTYDALLEMASTTEDRLLLPSPQEIVEEADETKLASERLTDIIGSLCTDREQVVLRHRYGLGMEDKKTLEELGSMLGITRERVRGIECAAVRKLQDFCYRDPMLAKASGYIWEDERGDLHCKNSDMQPRESEGRVFYRKVEEGQQKRG